MNRTSALPARAAGALALALAMLPVGVRAEAPPLISRDVLFGNPEKLSPRISPDGTQLAYLAPDAKNVMQVWVRTIGQADDKAVTQEKKRGIRRFLWAYNGTLLYAQDTDGDENFHVHGVDLKTGTLRDFTPVAGIRAEVVDVDPRQPDVVLVAANIRSRELHDIYRLNLKNGALDLDTENPGDVAGFYADNSMVVRAASAATPEGGTEIRVRANPKSPWKTWLKVVPQETVEVIGFTPDGKSLYLNSSLGSDTTRLVERNLATGAEQVRATSALSDLDSYFIHPTKHHVQAVSFNPAREE